MSGLLGTNWHTPLVPITTDSLAGAAEMGCGVGVGVGVGVGAQRGLCR